ncbi:MAG: nickel insertion protein [Myxococcota bacterium]
MSSSRLLHFDLSNGCTGRSLCAALIDLGVSANILKQAFSAINLNAIQPVYSNHNLEFLDETGRSIDSPAIAQSNISDKNTAFKAKPKWHLSLSHQDAPKMALPDVGDLAKNLDPIPAALFQKAKRFLEDAGHRPSLADYCDMVSFCVLLAELDPSSISASRVPLAFSHDNPNRSVILALSESIPVFEKEWPAPTCDVTGLALLKASASHFGARGESQLLKMGIAKMPEIRALLCQKNVTTGPKLDAVVEISAQITNTQILSEIIHRLNQIGTKKVWTTQVMDQGFGSKTLIKAIALESDKTKVIEALLILAEASDVQVQTIEQFSLLKRVTAVTLGRSQKLQVCRVNECLWGERILRVDPLLEDLQALAKESNSAQEIIRADVLSAWKKSNS